MKKLLASIVAIMLMLSALAIFAFAEGKAGEETDPYPNCSYETDNVADITPASIKAGAWWAFRIWPVVNGNLQDGTYGAKSGGMSTFLFTFDEVSNIEAVNLYFNGAGTIYTEGPDSGHGEYDTNSKYNEGTLKQTTGVKNVQIQLFDEEGNVLYDTAKSGDVTSQTSYLMSFPNNPIEGVKSIQIDFYPKTWQENPVINEIEIIQATGSHDWELVETIKPAKCNEAGEGRFRCECGVEKTDILPKTAHAQGNAWKEGMIPTKDGGEALGHYYECVNDGCTDQLQAGVHVYDGDCDDTCNVCNMTRTATAHQYGPSECDELCNGCGLKRDVDLSAHPHVYSHDCDAFCENCGDGERTPLADHNVDGDCDRICNDCGNATGATAAHIYTNKCDNECNICAHVRTGVNTDPNYDSSYDPDHDYTSDCDNYCNECNAVSTLTGVHNYSHDCQQICSKCKEVRTAPEKHTYDVNDEGKSCDIYCNLCKESRTPEIAHAYDNTCDEECNVCGYVRTTKTDDTFTPDHVWASDCDTACDSCGKERSNDKDHDYNNGCDAYCDLCGHVRTADKESADYDEKYDPDHDYDNSCDGLCNICGAQRTDDAYTPNHVWTSDCDKECDVCKHTRTVEPHKYQFNCSTVCSVENCGQKRQAAHEYDNACDDTCKFCNEKTREVGPHEFPSNDCTTVCKHCGVPQVEGSAHTFSEWVQTTAPERKTEGVNTRTCSVCGATETQAIPALGGISGGAVAGIVIGSVAVVGVGGFSVFWFVIKKKNFADLINVFKKKK